jgi:hypothetical protein
MCKYKTMLAIFVPFVALAENQAPPEVQKLAEGFNRTMIVCPQKIWSNYSWESLKVVLIYPSKSKSWVWDASKNTLQTVPNSELPASAIGSFFEFFNFNGHKAMSLQMEEGSTEVFELGVHEFFHHIGQEKWTNNQTGGRGTLYPLSGEPRFYRRMIYDNLKQYLQTGNQLSLGRAKYWFEKWSYEYSYETQSTTDGYEGTADYVETMATAVAKLGCTATDEQLKNAVINEVSTNYGFSVSGQHLALDSEGYEIGGLAALILRFNGVELSDWNRRTSAGETPLQVLLESVSPIAEVASDDLRNTFIQAAQIANQNMQPILDNDISNWNEKSYVRIPSPFNWLQSNFMPKFFAHSSELQLDLYPVSTDHHYISPSDGGSNFRLKTNAVIFKYFTTACSGQYFFTLVPEDSIENDGRTVNMLSGSVVGRLVGEIKTNEDGFKFFCVE